MVIFDATIDGLAMTVLNPYDETTDHIDDLMAVRSATDRSRPQPTAPH